MIRRTCLQMLAAIPFCGWLVSKPIAATPVKQPPTGLSQFRPTVQQEAFFRQVAGNGEITEALIEGSNRSGKTVAGAVWFASMALDEPVIMNDGTALHMRRDEWRGKPLELIAATGEDYRDAEEALFGGLFKAGVRFILPLIAFDQVDPSSRECRNDGYLSRCTLTNGTTIRFHSSSVDGIAPGPLHAAWVDEQVDHGDYWELMMRLVDDRGVMLWSVGPHRMSQTARESRAHITMKGSTTITLTERTIHERLASSR